MIAPRPELLVVDDLSSALDVKTEQLLWERLGTTTVLAVSHSIAPTGSSCSKPVVSRHRGGSTTYLRAAARCASCGARTRIGDRGTAPPPTRQMFGRGAV